MLNEAFVFQQQHEKCMIRHGCSSSGAFAQKSQQIGVTDTKAVREREPTEQRWMFLGNTANQKSNTNIRVPSAIPWILTSARHLPYLRMPLFREKYLCREKSVRSVSVSINSSLCNIPDRQSEVMAVCL